MFGSVFCHQQKCNCFIDVWMYGYYQECSCLLDVWFYLICSTPIQVKLSCWRISFNSPSLVGTRWMTFKGNVGTWFFGGLLLGKQATRQHVIARLVVYSTMPCRCTTFPCQGVICYLAPAIMAKKKYWTCGFLHCLNYLVIKYIQYYHIVS